MKGYVLSLWTTITLVLVAVVLISIAFIITLFTENSKIDIKILDTSNDNYRVAFALSDIMIENRQLLEHATETSFQKSASSEKLRQGIKSFIEEKYKYKNYRVLITDEKKNKLFYMDSSVTRCGPQLKGICTTKWEWKESLCGMGRIQLPDANECPEQTMCCINSDLAPTGGYLMQKCGKRDSGFCTSKITKRTDSIFSSSSIIEDVEECGEGREKIENTKCKNINSDQTPVCCAQAEQEQEKTNPIAYVPLIYSNSFGYLGVSVGGKK